VDVEHLMKDTDLLARVKWITDAVAAQDLGLYGLNSYLIRNGNIHANDGRMVVGTPFPFEGPDVLVPAEQFEKVLANKPEGDYSWEFEADRLVLRRGRFRGRIKTAPLDSWVMPTDLPIGLEPIPDNLIDGLTSLLPFVSANATKPWATCVGIVGDYMYASNNIAVARVPISSEVGYIDNEIVGFTGYMLPRWVVEFVVKRSEGLAAWLCNAQQVTFLWEDGSWMRSSLINDKWPPMQSLLDRYFQGDVDVEITDDWRKIIRRIAKIADDPVIRLRENECAGSTGEVLAVEDEAGTPVPEGKTETIWDLRYLEPVIAIATHWNPRVYPNPAPWRGEFIEGIIAGRRD
jgi:hypothetical protein